MKSPWRAGPLLPVLVTLALLLVPELVLRARAWPPTPEEGLLPSDPDTLWTLRPGARLILGSRLSISSTGLRGPERGPKPEGVRRIAFLGDSSVFGMKVNDPLSFPDQVARLLPGTEAVNAAVPGFSSEQALAQLRKRVLPLDPDLVVVCTLWSDNNFDAFVDADAIAAQQAPAARLSRLLQHSASFRALAHLRGAPTQRVGWGLLGQDTLLGRRRVELDRYAQNLDELVATAQGVGAQTLFVILANEEDLHQPDRAWPWDPYRAAMRDAATRHGTGVVEIPERFRQSGRGDALLADAMHPSVEGHRLIAEAIVAELKGRGWPDEPIQRGGTGGPPADRVDPWVDPAPAGAQSPAIAGVVAGPPGFRRPLRVEALDAAGQVLDGVDLPGPAPFGLRATGRVQLRVWSGNDPAVQETLQAHTLDLDARPAWGVRVDLATDTVTVPE